MTSEIHLKEAQADSKVNATDQADAEPLAPLWARVAPHVELAARVAFRGLPPDRRDDLTQEALGLAWKSFLTSASARKSFFDFPRLAARSIVCSVVRGRRLAGGFRRHEVFDWLSRRRAGVQLEQLDEDRHQDARQLRGLPSPSKGHTGCPSGVRGWPGTTPADEAALRVDLGDFLATLTPDEREWVRQLAEGSTCHEVAARCGLTKSSVSNRRAEWRRRWAALQGGPT